ncbi:MAG: phosphatidylserine decarboxylase family protein [Methanobacteriota archaeon]|nr:MAG: phosphatidylserine decarboxylase family protein [Euryarchaeota archaeon]
MKLAKGSLVWIVPFFLPIPLLFLSQWFWILVIPSVGFGIFQIWFFRDPNREILVDANTIYAPADGSVINSEIIEAENGSELRISVRMSPFDVHIIRAPMEFEVNEILHKRGAHRSVYFSGAEQKNERKLVTGSSASKEAIELLLITGAFARRIDLWITYGDHIHQGKKMGIIRFGSQTNFRLKTKRSLTLLVTKGDKVRAGLTPIARIE